MTTDADRPNAEDYRNRAERAEAECAELRAKLGEGGEADTHWHILTVTKEGAVSIIKNLDAPTARKAYQSLSPTSQPIVKINWPSVKVADRDAAYAWRPLRDDVFSQVTVIGPEGVDLDPWRAMPARLMDMTASWVSGVPVFIDSADMAMSMEHALEVRRS